MNSLWSFISRSENRQVLSWVGGAVIACATGLWAVVTYLYPANDGPGIVCAQGGSVAAGRNITGNTFNMNGGAPAGVGSGVASCADAAKK
jgi:hypothetical protein